MVAVGHSCSRHSSFLPVFHFQVTNVEISETCNTHKNILPLVRQQQEGRREGRATGPSEEGSSERAVRTSHCAFMAVCPVTHCTHLHKFYVNIGKNVTSSNSSWLTAQCSVLLPIKYFPKYTDSLLFLIKRHFFLHSFNLDLNTFDNIHSFTVFFVRRHYSVPLCVTLVWLCFFWNRRTEMHMRHDEIRQKYGQSHIIKLNF